MPAVSRMGESYAYGSKRKNWNDRGRASQSLNVFLEVAEIRAKAASVRDAPGEVVAVERRLAHCA